MGDGGDPNVFYSELVKGWVEYTNEENEFRFSYLAFRDVCVCGCAYECACVAVLCYSLKYPVLLLP